MNSNLVRLTVLHLSVRRLTCTFLVIFVIFTLQYFDEQWNRFKSEDLFSIFGYSFVSWFFFLGGSECDFWMACCEVFYLMIVSGYRVIIYSFWNRRVCSGKLSNPQSILNDQSAVQLNIMDMDIIIKFILSVWYRRPR